MVVLEVSELPDTFIGDKHHGDYFGARQPGTFIHEFVAGTGACNGVLQSHQKILCYSVLW